MARVANRSPEITRETILRAAMQLLRVKGTGFTLEQVARAAGVSKGGLLYHFASKNELLFEVARALIVEFDDDLAAAADDTDVAPGAFVRAYVRASLRPASGAVVSRDVIFMLTQLLDLPGVSDFAADYERKMSERLYGDGLPSERVDLVVAAANGAYAQHLWGGELPSAAALGALEKNLLTLTHI